MDPKACFYWASMIDFERQCQHSNHIWYRFYWGCNPFLEQQLTLFIMKSKQLNWSDIASNVTALTPTLSVNGPLRPIHIWDLLCDCGFFSVGWIWIKIAIAEMGAQPILESQSLNKSQVWMNHKSPCRQRASFHCRYRAFFSCRLYNMRLTQLSRKLSRTS